MVKYSIFTIARNALSSHKNWPQQWRSPEPKPEYEVIIIGGGGHGLATAYYLAKEHGVRNIAVLEKGWLGGGNTARNTTIVRSNYLWDESAAIYEKSLQLWEGLSQEINYNVMLSQRGVMNLAHSLGDVREGVRRCGMAGCGRGEGVLSDHQYLQGSAPPGPGRNLAAARWRCPA